MSRRWEVRVLVAVGLAVSLVLASVVSFYASSAPDGLDRVATDIGFADAARESAGTRSPLAGYGVDGVASDRVSGGLAGVIGLAVTALLAFALFTWLGGRSRRSATQTSAPEHDVLAR